MAALRAAQHELGEAVRQLSWERFISPMLDVVETLPEMEMARMAQALTGLQMLSSAGKGGRPLGGSSIGVATISLAGGVRIHKALGS
jgi:hypothetical protein